MNLRSSIKDFNELINITSQFVGIPQEAIKKDYFIVKILKNIEDNGFLDNCIFKGGTSLSKCYPNSINRFSEDIDLTYIPDGELAPNQYEKGLKKLEAALIGDFRFDKVNSERAPHSKSAFVYFGEDADDKIKLEIGSLVRPDPITSKKLKTYIQEFLEYQGREEDIEKFGLTEITVKTLSIERTFIDKLFAVRRHAIVGSLSKKVRHIYDVVKLYEIEEIQDFLADKDQFKKIVDLTKLTDAYFLGNGRPNAEPYDSMEPFDFKSWEHKFDSTIKKEYENLHTYLLYTDELQPFSKALEVFNLIDDKMLEIEE